MGEMSHSSKFESMASKLLDPELAISSKVTIIADIRDGIDITQTSEYSSFLRFLIPAFNQLLARIPVQYYAETPEQKARNSILELLSRLPMGESLRGYVFEILKTTMNVFENDNEENAAISLRLIVELHKSYRPLLESEVQEFLNLVLKIYTSVPVAVQEAFHEARANRLQPGQQNLPSQTGAQLSSSATAPTTSQSGTSPGNSIQYASTAQVIPPSSNPSQDTTLVKGIHSFKVLMECPVMVVMVFQLYNRFVAENIPKFVPPIIKILSINISDTLINTHRQQYMDFVSAQVKILSFLAYTMRQHANQLHPYQSRIPEFVIQLLRNCSFESSSTRKDLLVATRHILSTDFRSSFIPHIDTLIAEEILIGPPRVTFESLRSLAYGTLADLLNNIKQELSLPQISRVVHVYSKNLHDKTLPLNIQTLSVKLVLSFVDSILGKNEDSAGRVLLVRILDCLVNKVTSLKDYLPKLLKSVAEQQITGADESQSASSVVGVENIRYGVIAEPTSDTFKECRSLLKSLIWGIKSLTWGICTCSGVSQSSVSLTKSVFTMEEGHIFSRFLKNGFKCLSCYTMGDKTTSPGDEKEMLDQFAAVFTIIDVRTFQDVFTQHIDYLYRTILENQIMLSIPQHFLANQNVSKYFVEILLNYLVENLRYLDSTDKTQSTIILRLFKLVFSSINLFPDNELILQQHLSTIINGCLVQSTEVKDPTNYFQLLRSLFRCTGNHKFEHLLKEFLPLLPTFLESLNRLHATIQQPQLRNLIVELCLTVPVRLSNLLPHLHHVMKPLVTALEAENELALQGLRTLELFIDNMHGNFLEPFIQPVQTELMAALWKHLRPEHHAHQHQVLNILGKWGGHNRQFLKDFLQMQYKPSTESAIQFSLPFLQPNYQITLPADRLLEIIEDNLLKEGVDIYFKRQAVTFIISTISTLMNFSEDPQFLNVRSFDSMDDGDTKPTDYSLQGLMNPGSTYQERMKPKSISAYQRTTLVKMITTLIRSSETELQQEVVPFLESLTRHFALIAVSRENDPSLRNLVPDSDGSIIIDSILESASVNYREPNKVALALISILVDTCVALLGSVEYASELPLFDEFADKAARYSLKSDISCKSGSCVVIHQIIKALSPAWALRHELDFIKSIIVVMKNLSQHFQHIMYSDANPSLSFPSLEEGKNAILLLMKKCNSPSISKPQDPNYKVYIQLVQSLSSDISSPNSYVRSTIQAAFHALAEATETQVSDIIQLCRHICIEPILVKNMQILPQVAQIGYFDALTFFLNLRSQLLAFTPDLVKLLQEALKFVESEDSHGRHLNQKLRKLNISLKTAALDFMSAAMTCQEIQAIQHSELRNKITSAFFKALTIKSKEMVNTAKAGLTRIISVKIPKELLQSSLRPILLHLADHRKLTLPLLQGLSHLLELLQNCFNVTLGDKLLEHLKKWVEFPKIRISKIWKEGEELKIATAIMDLFHLLPSAASKFLEPLVVLTPQLESSLPPGTCSPYRQPLYKFLNRYTQESVDFFLNRISESQKMKVLIAALKSPICSALRAKFIEQCPRLIASTLRTNIPEAQFHGVHIIRILVKRNPELIVQNSELSECLITLFNSPERKRRFASEDQLGLDHLRETEYLLKILISLCKQKEDEYRLLFDMASIFTIRSVVDYSFLKDFLTQDISEVYSIQTRRDILQYFISFFKSNSSQEVKTLSIQLIIVPMLTKAFLKNEGKELVSPAAIQSIINDVVDAKTTETTVTNGEPLKIELLRLATLLVRYMSSELMDHRRDLIKYAWSHFKNDDLVSKNCAYILVCRFIEAYDTPPKIILQVYIGLLRAHQSDARGLVKHALEILTPNLPKRMPSQDRSPGWMKWTSRIVIEDGHSVMQLIHIWQVLVAFPNLFYPSRTQFAPYIANSLSKFGLSQSSPYEHRKLAIDLAGLIVNWEETAIKQRKMDTCESGDAQNDTMKVDSSGDGNMALKSLEGTGTSTDGANVNSISEDDAQIATHVVDITIRFLIRAAVAVSETRDTVPQKLIPKCIELLSKALQLGHDITVKLSLIEKYLIPPSTSEQTLPTITALEILNISADYQLKKVYDANGPQIASYLAPLFMSDNPKIVTLAVDFLRKVMASTPQFPPTHPVHDIAMKAKESLDQLVSNSDKGIAIILLLKTLSAEKLEMLDHYMGTLINAVQKLSKECVSYWINDPAQIPPNLSHAPGSVGHLGHGPVGSLPVGSPEHQNQEAVFKYFIEGINLASQRALYVPDARKPFFQLLLHIIEKSQNVELLLAVTKILKAWIFSPHPPVAGGLHQREKIGFILRMGTFENAGSELQHSLFDILYEIYRQPQVAPQQSSEGLQKLDPVFMLALRSSSLEIRQRFSTLFHSNVGKSVFEKLKFIFLDKEWDGAQNKLWIEHACDILLAAFDKDGVLNNPGATQNISSILTNATPALVGEKASALLQSHAAFMRRMSMLRRGEMIDSLRNLLYISTDLVKQTWYQIFPLAWPILTKEQQESITTGISMMFSRFPNHPTTRKSEVPQVLLESIYRLSPPIRLNSNLIKQCSKNLSCWYQSAFLMERIVSTLPDDRDGTHFEMLQQIYNEMGEEDYSYSIYRRRTLGEETRIGLSLQQYGFWQKAQELFLTVMIRHASHQTSNMKPYEVALWEDRWLASCRHLNQWEILFDFAKHTSNTEILLEASWKNKEWNQLKDAFNLNQHTELNSSYTGLILQLYHAIAEEKLTEVKATMSKCLSSVVIQWCSLPGTPGTIHNQLLQIFQQLVELQESITILQELSNTTNRTQVIQEVRNILSAWRERLPNTWEDMTVWSDVLQWRHHIFSKINTSLQSVEGGQSALYLGFHETAWTINRFSRIARKHKLVDVSLGELSKIYSLPNIEILDAFVKLQEQVKCYFQIPGSYRTGLDTISSTNLDYFGKSQKAEFFRLKAEFQHLFGQNDDANSSFAVATQTDDNLASGWISWALFCDNVYQQDRKKIGWAESAMSCFLTAARLKSDRARRLLARVLVLLTYDDDFGFLAKSVDGHIDFIQSWVWLTWAPHMLHSLQYGDNPLFRRILSKLCSSAYQEMFYQIRTFLLAQRKQSSEVIACYPLSSNTEKPSPLTHINVMPVQSGPSQTGSTQSAYAAGNTGLLAVIEALLNAMRRSNATIVSDMEHIVEEICMKLRPDPEEDLVSNLVDLMHVAMKSSTRPLPDKQQLPQVLNEGIGQIWASYFKLEDGPARNEKFDNFTNEYRPHFEKEFMQSPLTINSLVSTIKKWVRAMTDRISRRRNKNSLDLSCRFLYENIGKGIEIPGQYIDGKEPSADLHVRLERIDIESHIFKRGSKYKRRYSNNIAYRLLLAISAHRFCIGLN
eukprot:TRINITY_DN7963_c0_g1_i1.p1 TRINITY_DN7963_c0_g1~~TRINITY_DN7963_c0_g1_i1.p1  ORF type:complete len:3345 (+),score=544.19 TRINITY_DN7963_c0_g1_i1:49-10083(+)